MQILKPMTPQKETPQTPVKVQQAVLKLTSTGNTFVMARALEKLILLYKHVSTDTPAEREDMIEAINQLGEFLNDINSDIAGFYDQKFKK